jgi:hypothetical protein
MADIPQPTFITYITFITALSPPVRHIRCLSAAQFGQTIKTTKRFLKDSKWLSLLCWLG